MTTEKLYLKDIQSAYKTRFNGKIVNIEENKIILDMYFKEPYNYTIIIYLN